MRIVQLITASQFRGAEMFAYQLSKHLKVSGVDVTMISLFEQEGRLLTMQGVSHYELRGKKRGFLNWRVLFRLARELRRLSPDLVQANAGETLKYATIAKLLFGMRYRIVFRNASMVGQYLKTPWHRRFYGWIYQSVDRVVSISQKTKSDFCESFPSERHKVTVIPNGIDRPAINTVPNLDASKIYFVHVAGFSFEKNHAGVLRIFERIKLNVPNAVLWLLGDGPLRSQIQAAVVERNIPDVVFLGSVDNPWDYISAARMLWLPSLIEGMPAVVLEAMASRTPVVAYDVGGVSELIINDVTGWLVPRNDESSFVEAVVRGLTYTEQRMAEITDEALRVSGQYDGRLCSSKFEDVYRTLIGGAP